LENNPSPCCIMLQAAPLDSQGFPTAPTESMRHGCDMEKPATVRQRADVDENFCADV
jgi:hypothetical protein